MKMLENCKQFKINLFVRVKLTPAGIKTLISYYNKNNYLNFPVENERDLKKVLDSDYNMKTKVYEVQLHELMRIFGPECFAGGDNQFVDNIIFIPEDELV